MTDAGFIQMIHLKTDKMEEIDNLYEEWRDRIGSNTTVLKTTVVEDMDNRGWYMIWVEFSDYEAAMKNSRMSVTEDFAARLSSLCESGPDFCNLAVNFIDVIGS